MATFTSNRQGGSTDEQGHFRFHVKAWAGNVLSGLAVVQNSPLAMSVLVQPGDLKIDYSGYGYTAWSDTSPGEVVTINTASTTNPRIDRIIAYIDRGMATVTDPPNNPGLLKFVSVAGTPASSPVKPSDSTVNSQVGATNPWCELATVSVATSVSTISNTNITDTRQLIRPPLPANSVDSQAIGNGTVTPINRSGGFKTGSFTTNATTGNRAITGVGFKPRMIKLTCTRSVDDTSRAYLSVGAADESGAMNFAYVGTSASNPQTRSGTTLCIRLIEITGTGGGDTAAAIAASYVSMDADGFTLNFTNTKTGYVVNWEAYA